MNTSEIRAQAEKEIQEEDFRQKVDAEKEKIRSKPKVSFSRVGLDGDNAFGFALMVTKRTFMLVFLRWVFKIQKREKTNDC